MPLSAGQHGLVGGKQFRRQCPVEQEVLRLRIAGYLGRKEGWLAEHMLVLGLRARREKSPTLPQPFRVHAARPIWQCSAPAVSKVGAYLRLETISPGCGSGEMDACGRSIRGRLFRGRPRNRRSLESQRDGNDPKRHDIHQRHADARYDMVGRHGDRTSRRHH